MQHSMKEAEKEAEYLEINLNINVRACINRQKQTSVHKFTTEYETKV